MIKKILSFSFLALLTFTGFAQKKAYPIGEIFQEKVNKNDEHSYQVYFPKSIKKQPLAVLIIFDPSGSSKSAMKKFQEAADIYQTVLFCSDQSKNGRYDRNIEIFENMYADMQAKFDIKKLPKILTGFSGGSRLATVLAVTKKELAGVIACGAGLPPIEKYKPTKKSDFGYFGIVGSKDMNYSEMLKVEQELTTLDIDHHFLYTNEGHVWPASKDLMDALVWQLARLEKRGKLQMDAFIQVCLGNTQNQLNEQWRDGEVVDYRNTILAIENVFPTARTFLKTKEIKEKDWQAASTERKKMMEEEIAIRKNYHHQYELSKYQARDFKSDEWWLSEYKKWSKKAEKPPSNATDQAARMKYGLYAMFFESTANSLLGEEYARALWSADLLARMVENNVYAYYLAAKAAALLQQFSAAEKRLELAVKHGLTKKQSILREPAFDILKGRKRFEKLLETLE